MTSSLIAAASLLLAGDVVFTGHGARANSVAFSPDGKQLASGASDGTIIVWDAAKGSLVKKETLSGGAKVVDVAWRGKTVVAATTNGLLVEWEPGVAKSLRTTEVQKGSWVSSVAALDGDEPDSYFTAAGTYDGKIWLWDRYPQDGDVVSVDAEVGAIGAVAIFPGSRGKVLVVPSSSSAATDKTVNVVDLASRTSTVLHRGMHASSGALAASGAFVAAAAETTVHVWSKGTEQRILAESPLTSLAFSPSADRIAAGSVDGLARIWSLPDSGAAPLHFEGHGDSVTDVAFSPDGKRLATSSKDGTVRLWDLAGKRRTAVKATARPIVFDGDFTLNGSCEAAIAAHLEKRLPSGDDAAKTFPGSEFVPALFKAPGCLEFDDTRTYMKLAPGQSTAAFEPFDPKSLALDYASGESGCDGHVSASFTVRFGDKQAPWIVGHTKLPASVPYRRLDAAPPAEPTIAELEKMKRKTISQTFTAAPGFAKVEVRTSYVLAANDPSGPGGVFSERVDLLGWLPGAKSPLVLHREDALRSEFERYPATLTDLVVTDLEGDSHPDVLFTTARKGRAHIRVVAGASPALTWLSPPNEISQICD